MIIYLYAPTLRKVVGLRIKSHDWNIIKTKIQIGIHLNNVPLNARRTNVKNPRDITEGFEDYEVRHKVDGWYISKKIAAFYILDCTNKLKGSKHVY